MIQYNALEFNVCRSESDKFLLTLSIHLAVQKSSEVRKFLDQTILKWGSCLNTSLSQIVCPRRKFDASLTKSGEIG